MPPLFQIREIKPDEYPELARLMIEVYSSLEGFPSADEQPAYYEKLANIGRFNEQPDSSVLVAVSDQNELMGGIVYFSNMASYGSGGTATMETNASGIRLLGVDPRFRGTGTGKALTLACIQLARQNGHSQIILHTTQAMQVAWDLYHKIGFVRSTDLDFTQDEFPIFGFRLRIS